MPFQREEFIVSRHQEGCSAKFRIHVLVVVLNFRWVEVNPGLLKVKLQFISPFAHDLNRN